MANDEATGRLAEQRLTMPADDPVDRCAKFFVVSEIRKAARNLERPAVSKPNGRIAVPIDLTFRRT